uniref:Helicase ATP-binding domain-containing protein n=1 Tax=viral metagenome TaxID=1070528 RepID=A0A6C0ES43_9ZZZZ
MNLDTKDTKSKKPREKRCPNGTRKNKRTGNCDPITTLDVVSETNIKNVATAPVFNAESEPVETNIENVATAAVFNDESEPVETNIKNVATAAVFNDESEPVETNIETVATLPVIESVNKKKNKNNKTIKSNDKRCPNGTRRNQKTGICEPINPITITNPRESELPEPPVRTSFKKSSAVIENTEIDSNEPTEKADTLINIDSSISGLDKESNNYLLKKEKLEYDYNATNTDYDFLYPELNDPNFNIKIAKRKEFNDTKYDGTIHDIKKQANIMCNAKFELMPHQLFVKNFMSFQTPYNSLLLFNALGSGKTCSAIGIAEEMRSYMKQIGIKQRIIVVASPNVQSNFRLQLFDERKLELIRNSNIDTGLWNIESCIGNALIHEVNPTQLKGLPRDKVISHIKRIINNYYLFMGYGQLANYISNSIKNEGGDLTGDALRKMEIRKIKKIFNNRLIIIDEVHNIRLADDNNSEKKKTAVLLMKVAKYAENMRLLLLSATPMFNSYKEIVWLTNLMNINDKRATIEMSDIFDKDGNFKQSSKGEEGGRELLQRKLTGYVSYVRGENPYSFPYRIYPSDFAKDHTFLENAYPKKQMNDSEIDASLRYINIYTNKIGEYQSNGYKFIIDYMKQRSYDTYNKYGEIREMPSFENMESFGYTLLQTPLEALNIVYPNTDMDKMKDITDVNAEQIIVDIVGKNGLSKIMNSVEETQQYQKIRYNFEYKPDVLKKYGPIFKREHLHKYSAKIANICDIISKSKGIVLIYSQYIDGGVVPLALALEEMGFSRYSSSQNTKNLFKTPRTEQIDAITMKPKSMFDGDASNFNPAKYVMITGEKAFSPNNAADIKYVTNNDNINGEKVKVILISKAGAEGLDFKCIRQIHILEPWYNMNRIEQIIGRGVRNLSHCRLPFEERNVEIYLHGTILDTEDEAADLYVYRLAEKKALQIGKVTRMLKEISVDCILNIGQNNYTVEKMLEIPQNQNIEINLSSNKTIQYNIGDKPFTDICDYMDNCSYVCSPNTEIGEKDIIRDTYTDSFVKMNQDRIISRIMQLYREHNVYSRNQLINSINIVKQYPIEQIFSALTYLIENKNEYLVDKYGRLGNLVNKDMYYLFQPIEITDENASMYERTAPIDYKRKSFMLEYSTNLQTYIPEESKKTKLKTIQREPAQNVEKEEEKEEKEEGPKGSQKIFSILINEIEELLDFVYNTKKLTKGEKNWYKHAAFIIDILINDFGFTNDNVREYMIEHILDMLLFSDKMILIQHFYIDNVEPNGLNEKLIQQYLDKRIVRSGNYRGIVLMKDDILKIFTKSENNELVEVDADDYQLFVKDLVRFDVKKNTLNNLVGFVNLFTSKKSNQKEMVFKIKDLTQKRNNTGARADDAGKEKIIKFLNIILEENKYNDENTEKITQIGLCAILEFIMRRLNLVNNKGKVFFLNPEQTAITQIVKFSF